MVTFVFWNLNKQPLQGRLAKLVAKYKVDVLMLAECEAPADEVRSALNAGGGSFCHPHSEGEKLEVFTRFPESSLVDLFNNPMGGLSIQLLALAMGMAERP